MRLYDFITANVTETIIDNNKINFDFKILDSQKFYVERINIIGNYQTIEEVIRNRFIVDEGDPLNELLFNKSIDRVKSLGIFKKVETKISDGSDKNLKIVDLIVEEQPTGEISLAAGVVQVVLQSEEELQKKIFRKGVNLMQILKFEDKVKVNLYILNQILIILITHFPHQLDQRLQISFEILGMRQVILVRQ